MGGRGLGHAGRTPAGLGHVRSSGGQGANHFEIAAALHWSERTIRRRLTAIRLRLGAMSTIEAVAIAASRGELRPRELADTALLGDCVASVSLATNEAAATPSAEPDMKGVSDGPD